MKTAPEATPRKRQDGRCAAPREGDATEMRAAPRAPPKEWTDGGGSGLGKNGIELLWQEMNAADGRAVWTALTLKRAPEATPYEWGEGGGRPHQEQN
jgi:hypothetical protein